MELLLMEKTFTNESHLDRVVHSFHFEFVWLNIGNEKNIGSLGNNIGYYLLRTIYIRNKH